MYRRMVPSSTAPAQTYPEPTNAAPVALIQLRKLVLQHPACAALQIWNQLRRSQLLWNAHQLWIWSGETEPCTVTTSRSWRICAENLWFSVATSPAEPSIDTSSPRWSETSQPTPNAHSRGTPPSSQSRTDAEAYRLKVAGLDRVMETEPSKSLRPELRAELFSSASWSGIKTTPLPKSFSDDHAGFQHETLFLVLPSRIPCGIIA